MSIGRLLAAIVISEMIPILVLTAVVFVYGAIWGRKEGVRTPQEFARDTGEWLGPIAGALAVFVIAWYATRHLERPLLHTTIIGVGTGILDFALTMLLTRGTPFRWLYALSALGRAVAGALAGLVR